MLFLNKNRQTVETKYKNVEKVFQALETESMSTGSFDTMK